MAGKVNLQIPRGADRDDEDLLFDATVRAHRDVSRAARTGPAEPELLDVDDDAVVELHYGDGLIWLTSAGSLRETSRERGDGTGAVQLPRTLGLGAAARGDDGWLERIRVTEFAGTEIEDVIEAARAKARESAEDLVKRVVADLGIDAWIARAVARWIEDRIFGKEHPEGLYYLKEEGLAGRVKDGDLDSDDGYTLLLHGTFSSIDGSYSDLFDTDHWKRVIDQANGRVLAYQHRTLSEGPVENAVHLLTELPDVPVDLLTYSRGGLVGELLSTEVDDAQIDRLRSAGNEIHADALARLAEARNRSDLEVRRFVRVACPADGTTLMSDRLDKVASVGTKVMERIGSVLLSSLSASVPAVAPASELVKRSLPHVRSVFLALLRARAEVRYLPGLACMDPASPFIGWLNRTETTAPLTLVTGDVVPSRIRTRLKVFLADAFYGPEHDYVVPTPSMRAGPLRPGATIRRLADTGDRLSHFTYFERETSRDAICGWLADDHWSGDHEWDAPAAGDRGAIAANFDDLGPLPSRPTAPLTFFVPGIMGTHLEIGKERIWLDLGNLQSPGMTALANPEKAAAPAALVKAPYDRLAGQLAESHHVVPFPYDWRRSVLVEGERLGQMMAAALADGRTVRVLAHSMGGLVARAALLHLRAVGQYDTFRRRGGRLVQAGTPNHGSPNMLRKILRGDMFVRMIAGWDSGITTSQLRNLIAQFPGVLELLPWPDADTNAPWFDSRWWKSVSADVLPKQSRLDAAKETHRRLSSFFPEADVVYVAGMGPERFLLGRKKTDVGYDPMADEFQTDRRGDTAVPWQTGIPANVKTFWLDTAHGSLLESTRDMDSHAGYLDLLENGTTTQSEFLGNEPTSGIRGVRGEGGETIAEPRLWLGISADTEPVPPTPRTETELLRAVLSMRDPSAARPVPNTLQVSVTAGSLHQAHYPVMVGHYDEDDIVSAERFLDGQLDGALGRKHRLGQYPGPIGTSLSTDFKPEAHPTGALVVGLGDVGELSSQHLRGTVREAVKNYCHQYGSDGSDDERGDLGLTSVLIGANGGTSFGVAASVGAIVGGVVDANEELLAAGETARVTRLEFVEVVDAIAEAAADAVRSLQTVQPMSGDGDWRIDAAQSIRPEPPTISEAPFVDRDDEWVQRIRVRFDEKRSRLSYEVLTRRARGERFERGANAELVHLHVDGLKQTTSAEYGGEGAAVGRVLMERMLPYEMLPSFESSRDIQLLLDAKTGQFPWEAITSRESANGPPLATRSAMVRQLFDRTPTLIRREVRRKRVIVLADLIPGPGALPGAEAEGHTVAGKFDPSEWTVVQRISPARDHAGQPDELRRVSQEIDTLLAGDSTPMILHVAAHGDVAPLPGREDLHPRILLPGLESGWDGSVFESLDRVPALVFLNCCHVGSLEDGSQFAPSIARTLIDVGARAVIAAGWAVDDAAARTFAEAFYDRMLRGHRLADAARHARYAAWNQHRGSNTWAAYQVWGDPSFRLPAGDDGDSTRTPPTFVSARLARHALERSLLDASSDRQDSATQTIDDVEAHSNRSWWRGDGALHTLRGLALAEVGRYADAIGAFESALAVSSGGLLAVERVVDAWSRVIRSANDGPGLDSATTIEDLRPLATPDTETNDILTSVLTRANAAYERLLHLAEAVPTSERWSLIGSHRKERARALALWNTRAERSAATEDTLRLLALRSLDGDPVPKKRGAAAKHLVRSAREAYARSADLSLENGAADLYYPLTLEACLTLAEGREVSEDRLEAAEASAALAFGRKGDTPERPLAGFVRSGQWWQLVALVDARVARAWAEGKLGKDRNDILSEYASLRRSLPSGRGWGSTAKNWRIFADLCTNRDQAKELHALADGLDGLARES